MGGHTVNKKKVIRFVGLGNKMQNNSCKVWINEFGVWLCVWFFVCFFFLISAFLQPTASQSEWTFSSYQ